MTSETKQCQNCKQSFVIEPDDFSFYEKIKVPPPTFCPDCRLQRRLAWRNERTLYKATCGSCKKDIFSAYPADSPFPIFCYDCWFGDGWDPLDYGMEYDFSKPFFAQVKMILAKIPRLHLFQRNSIGSPYANIIADAKNVYLSYSIVGSEEVFYSKNIDRSKEVFDSLNVVDSERCFWNVYGAKNFDAHYAVLSSNNLDAKFIFNCRNVQRCFLAAGLRNKKYIVKNVAYPDETTYMEALRGIDTGSHKNFSQLLGEFLDMKRGAPHRYAAIVKAERSTGDALRNVKNACVSFDVYDAENVKYAQRCLGLRDAMDVTNTGLGSELIYEYVSGGKANRNLKFAVASIEGLADCAYAGWCGSSSNLFGCVGLRGKSYCILNKQYTKEEYNKMVPKIIEHMNAMPYEDAKGRLYRYGEFFPVELSPFPYNATIAQEHVPLTKEEVLAQGFRWGDEVRKRPIIDISAEDLPDHIKDTDDNIVRKNIGCAHEGQCIEQCTVAFRVIPQELALYKKINFSVPRLCPNCRHYDRLKMRNPWKLWHRRCTCAGAASENGAYQNTAKHFHASASCPNEFETSYAPDRPEVVYCEQCYNAEIV